MEWWILVGMIVVAILATTWAAAMNQGNPSIGLEEAEEGQTSNGDHRVIPPVS